MTTRIHSDAGFSIFSAVVAIILVGVAGTALIQLSSSVGEHRREMDTRVQEDSFRVFQSEIAISGANPSAMNSNPLSGARTESSPMPTITYVTEASSSQAGSASVNAYAASSDDAGRSSSLGYRIASTGVAVASPTTSPLSPPTFRVSGLIDDSEFTPNLTNLILGAASNPPGTVYRYTTDGSTPTSSSPIWSTTSSLPGYPLPPTVNAGAFNSDPSYTQSAIVTANLMRDYKVIYGRSGGGTSTGFTYAEVTGGVNAITLSLTASPSGTRIFYTIDGTAPSSSSTEYTAPFHVPLSSWASSITLRATATTPEPITVIPLSIVLTPTVVALPSPTFGTQGGTSTSASIPVSVGVPGVVIRYDIDNTISTSSPVTSSGNSITVVAP